MSNTNVPVGVSSAAGYTVTLATFAAAVVAYLSGDHSQGNLVVIALGIFSAISFLTTQVGRYKQAIEKAKRPAPDSPALPGSRVAMTTPKPAGRTRKTP